MKLSYLLGKFDYFKSKHNLKDYVMETSDIRLGKKVGIYKLGDKGTIALKVGLLSYSEMDVYMTAYTEAIYSTPFN